MLSETNLQWSGDRFPNFEAARKGRRQTSQPPTACGLEKLEPRRMFASVNMVGSVLVVTGNSTDDSITIYEDNSGNIGVDINGGGDPSGLGPYSGVTRVDVDALGGNDGVYVESALNGVNYGQVPVDISTRLTGGSGDDTVFGGDAADTIYGGYGGGDLIRGFSGNDVLYGGDGGAGGNDETGGDAVYGGAGDDTLFGEGGNDLLYGGDGNMGVTPNTGNDFLYGGAGNDYINPENGDDWAFGGLGNDTFRGSHFNDSDYLDGEGGTDDVGSAGVDYDSPLDSLFNFP